jgi:hypothetical protein
MRDTTTFEETESAVEVSRREESTGAENSERKSSVTLRVAVLSILLAATFGYVIPIIDFKFNNTFLGAAHLPVGAAGVLLLLLLVVNPLLRWLSRSAALSRNESLTVYITCLFSTLVPGRGAENFWVTNVIASFYLSTRENHWFDSLQPYLKPWLSPALTSGGKYNQDVVEGWYLANGSIPTGAWLVPCIAWGILVIALYTMLACLAVILRAQWAQREALSFPLLRLPLEMTQDEDSTNRSGILSAFFRNPLMWVGFFLVFAAQALNGLNNYFPDVPRLPMQIRSAGMFTEAPWNQLYPTTFLFWPIVFGLSYLLTTEVAFSLWFFYWAAKFQLIFAYYMGFQPDTMPSPTWTRGWAKSFIAFEQIGAYIAYLAIILWAGREHYKFVTRRAFGREPSTPDERDEALSYPAAFWGFTIAFAIVLAWTVAAGVRLDIALALWLTYLMIALILTRVVAEAGLLFVQSGWAPLGPIADLAPATWFNSNSVVPAAFIQGGLMTDMRGFLLPSFVQSFKLAKDRGIAARPLLGLIAVCTIVAMAIGWWNILRLGHSDVGGLQLETQWSRGNIATLPAQNSLEIIKSAPENLWVNWSWLGAGVLMTWGMMWMRSHFLWFPLHPIGLIMCWPTAMYAMWFSIFLAWLCKVVIIRYSGNDTYRRLMPFFLGIALGDIASMLFWLVIDGWQGFHGHVLMPQS